MLFRSNDTATTEIYTLSLHDALPISAFIECRTGEIPEPRLGEKKVLPAGFFEESQARRRQLVQCLIDPDLEVGRAPGRWFFTRGISGRMFEWGGHRINFPGKRIHNCLAGLLRFRQ